MKKNHFILLFAIMLFLPLGMKAQKSAKPNELLSKQVKDQAYLQAKVTASLIRKKYNADESTVQFLSKLFYAQKLAIDSTMIRFQTAPDLEKKITLLIAKHDSINEVYFRSLKTKSIFKNKVLRSDDNSRFALAIKIKDQLKLDSIQVNKLFIEANRAYNFGEKEEFNLREFERKELPKVLTEVQYTNLLRWANHKQALTWAKGDWKEMQERGLIEGLDSAKVVKEIYQYDVTRLVTKDKFGSSIPSSSSLSVLEVPMPASLSKLKSARKYNNPVPDKSSNVSFAW